MKILIATIGKAKKSPEQQLMADYLKRLKWKVKCVEFEVKCENAAERKTREGEQLLAACKGYDVLVALDEKGKALGSREFADTIKGWTGKGKSSFAFVIGGADGLSAEVTGKAQLIWSFGRVTWPHMLMRALLAEQLYRAQSILDGHPYHRD